jgi:isovaleryl-CoA dehydrogenase
LFRDAIREFARREVAPLVAEAEKTNTLPRQLFRKMAAPGFLCLTEGTSEIQRLVIAREEGY